MALVVAQEVPTSSTHGRTPWPGGRGRGTARMREDLLAAGLPDTVVDDAVLILSELLSNACRHGRPLGRDESATATSGPLARATKTGELTIAVTDGGGPTRHFRPLRR